MLPSECFWCAGTEESQSSGWNSALTNRASGGKSESHWAKNYLNDVISHPIKVSLIKSQAQVSQEAKEKRETQISLAFSGCNKRWEHRTDSHCVFHLNLYLPGTFFFMCFRRSFYRVTKKKKSVFCCNLITQWLQILISLLHVKINRFYQI